MPALVANIYNINVLHHTEDKCTFSREYKSVIVALAVVFWECQMLYTQSCY